MKNILFVYDRMMMGGTTTALLSLLKSIDYSEYSVDLLLFKNTGPFLEDIPKEVNLLDEAYKPIFKGIFSPKLQKAFLSIFDGSAFSALRAFFKYRTTNKGNLPMILFHFFGSTQVKISRRLFKEYDAAVSFIEGWSNHFVLSDKVRAKHKSCCTHPDYINSYLIPEADKKAFKKANNLLVVSENCKKNMCAVFPEYADKVAVLENICSAAYVKERAKNGSEQLIKHSLDMCTVCRCDSYVKGLDRMVEALGRLKSEGILGDAHWHLIGDGDDFESVKMSICEKGLSDNVTMYGQKQNPLALLSQMDLFVLTSRYEGKPVSVMEALALGIPCLVTAYASSAEQISHGVNGFITENSGEGVYLALKQIIEDAEQLKTYKKELSYNNYDNSTEIKKLYDLWND